MRAGTFGSDGMMPMETAVALLEGEARRRALHGREEPVFHQGEEVARVTKYSDNLLMFLLKGLKPEMYRETRRLEPTGASGGPMLTIDEMNDAQLRALLGEDDAPDESKE